MLIVLTNDSFRPGRLCLQYVAAKRKCMMTKEGLKKNRRVYSKGMDSLGAKKNEKGKGMETENRKKWKRDKDDYEDDEVEDRVMEMEENWRSFVMTRMIRMDVALEGLAKENVELKKEVREMQRENMEDWREYFWEVGKVRKDIRVMENWVRQIVEWVQEKKSEEESEEESEDGEMREKEEIQELEEKSEEMEKEMEAEGKRWGMRWKQIRRQRKRWRKRRWKRRKETEMWRWWSSGNSHFVFFFVLLVFLNFFFLVIYC